jgi:multidrug transporter EmrE-like cation transporter
MWLGYAVLIVAILFENIGTTALKGSNGFKRPVLGSVAVFGYILSFAFMGQALARLPLAIAYSIWSGLGMSVVTLTGILVYKENFGWKVALGLLLIFLGVMISNYPGLVESMPGVAR